MEDQKNSKPSMPNVLWKEAKIATIGNVEMLAAPIDSRNYIAIAMNSEEIDFEIVTKNRISVDGNANVAFEIEDLVAKKSATYIFNREGKLINKEQSTPAVLTALGGNKKDKPVSECRYLKDRAEDKRAEAQNSLNGVAISSAGVLASLPFQPEALPATFVAGGAMIHQGLKAIADNRSARAAEAEYNLTCNGHASHKGVNCNIF